MKQSIQDTKCVEEAKKENIELKGWGQRHTICVLAFMIILTAYMMRVNLSVAIVAMVSNTTVTTTNESISKSCPLPDDYNSTIGKYPSGDFKWDEKTQGLVLGSFYYGYACTNALAGRAAELFGPRLVLGIGIILTSCLTILSPLAARQSATLFIVIRILEGCTQGCTFPSTNYLIANWYPVHERSKYSGYIYAGCQIGTVIAMAISGWLCSSNFLGGWPSAFYVFGAWGIFLATIWIIFVRDYPAKHPRISDRELEYILSGCADKKDEEKVPIPFKAIFTSRHFWAISVMHFGYNWGFYTLLSELPTYLDKIQHMNIQASGFISAMPYLGAYIFSILFSYITDKLLARGMITLLVLRKLAMIFSGYGPMICLLLLCVVSCHSGWVIALLIISGSLNGASFCGYMCSHSDIAPRFAGTLMGMTNTIAAISGFVGPSVTGALTQDNQTLWAWRTLFLITAVIYGISVTVYNLFITTDIQPWNDPKKEK